MSISPVTYSVFPTANTATYSVKLNQPLKPTLANAIDIGNLTQESSIISVSDQGTTSGVQSYSFTLNDNTDSAYLNTSFSTLVGSVTTDVQLIDSQGNVIADNQGNDQQQNAYTELTSSGLTPGAGTYSVQVTPSTYEGAPQIALSVLQQEGTSLSVNSTLTPSDPAEYYNFSLSDGNNIKLAASNSTAHIQLLNSKGHVVADNQGNTSQKDYFSQLTSGTGLASTPGNYTVAVSYPTGTSNPNQNLNYNFQLYSGTNYSVVDQTTAVANSTPISASASVTAAQQVQTFTQETFNTIGETATSAVASGYLQSNKTSLSITGQLSTVDSSDYYSFGLQSGNNLKLALSNLTDSTATSNVRVQLLDNSGGEILADNQGTTAQQAAYKELTSGLGLNANPAYYVVKVSYGHGAAQTQSLDYNVQLYSGDTYSSVYKTTASSQTYENAVLRGNFKTGYSAYASAAAYLTGVQNDTATNVIAALQTSI